MIVTDKFGQQHEYKLDIKAILDAESKDPSYSFLHDLEQMGTMPRLTTLARIATSVGGDLESMLSYGFTMDKIADIFTKCLEESGFISAEQE